jgi:hypothetical protein
MTARATATARPVATGSLGLIAAARSRLIAIARARPTPVAKPIGIARVRLTGTAPSEDRGEQHLCDRDPRAFVADSKT